MILLFVPLFIVAVLGMGLALIALPFWFLNLVYRSWYAARAGEVYAPGRAGMWAVQKDRCRTKIALKKITKKGNWV